MTTWKNQGNGESKNFLKDVKGLIVIAKNTTQTVAAAKTLAGWQTLINPATTGAIKATYIDFERGFELQTPKPEMATSNTGFKEKTKDFPPEFTGYGNMSYDDYKTWFPADGKEFDFVPVMQDGKILAPTTSAGLQIGFFGRLFVNYDLPKAGGAEKQKAHEFTIMFDDVEQMKSAGSLKTDFTRRDLASVVPVGINIEVITAYENTGGTVVVKATKRATSEPYSGLGTTANWEVVSLSADTGGACTAISATQSALGIYTLTFLNSAAKLTGAFEIQANAVAASHITYVSNVLNIPVS